MSGFDNRSDLPPPHYDWSQHDFDSKIATATDRSLHQSFAPISGPAQGVGEDDFETWSDAKFEAAARAFEARQAKRRMQATAQPGASGSGPGPAPNRATPAQYDPSRQQTYQLDRSQTPRPSDYAHPYYSLAPPSAPASAPTPTQMAPAPAQSAVPPYMQVPPPSNAVSNEHEPSAAGGAGLQRAVSLFRTPSISRNDDHGEQLPAFTDVALPEEMVPQDMAQTGPTSAPAPPPPPTLPQSPPPPHTFSPPPTIPQSPPPPHTFSPPSNPPPPPPHNVRAQTGPTYLSPTTPQSPPPPHTFSAPSSPSPALHNVQPPALPPLNASRPRPVSHASAPASPIHTDPPPAFIPSNSHYPIPEKTNPHTYPHLGNPRGMSSPMSVYASANRTTYAPPTINFDLETAYGRATSPGLPKETGASLYSSAVSSTMSGRQLPKPGGGRPRSTLPPPPEPSPWTGVGGQQGTYGGLNQASTYSPQYQQPYQPGGFYAQPLAQQPCYGQNQPPQQGTHWNNQYPSYGLTTPPPGAHGQPAWGTPAAQWPGNGGHYRP